MGVAQQVLTPPRDRGSSRQASGHNLPLSLWGYDFIGRSLHCACAFSSVIFGGGLGGGRVRQPAHPFLHAPDAPRTDGECSPRSWCRTAQTASAAVSCEAHLPQRAAQPAWLSQARLSRRRAAMGSAGPSRPHSCAQPGGHRKRSCGLLTTKQSAETSHG